MYVKDQMTRNPICIDENTPISKALDIMANKGFHRLPIVDNDTMDVSDVSYTEGGYMASDSLTGDIDPITDNKSSYFSDVKNNLIPSPYSGHGRNSIYYTDVPGSNALSDFDGYTNTQTLVGLGSGYTAANAAWNYKDAANKCQWYLPAMGELGFMFARIKLIDKSYSKLKGRAGILYDYVWSSTETPDQFDPSTDLNSQTKYTYTNNN